MPTPKRWFHCSQEINLDPEVWSLTEQFGDRAIRTWLQILSYLDRSENRWRMTEESLKTVGRITRQQPKNCGRQILWMVSTGWLTILQQESSDSSTVLQASNWLKYNKTQETKKQFTDSSKVSKSDPLLSLPSLSSPHHTNKKNKRRTHKEGLAMLEDFQITDAMRDWARQEYSVEIPDDVLAEFKDHWRNEKKLRTDWGATFKSRIRQLVNWGNLRPKPQLMDTSGPYHKKVCL